MGEHTVLLTSNTSWYLWKFRQGTIKALVAEGYEVLCLAPKDAYSDKLAELGAKFLEIPLEGKSIGPLRELKSLWAIFTLLRQLRPVFVFNFTIKMNLYVGLSCRVLGLPYANNVSGLGTVFLHQGLVYRLAQKLYGLSNAGAHCVFFQNTEDRQTFIQLGLVADNKACLLPGSGIDLQHYAFAALPRFEPITFIMIARLIADKGVREYVDAAKIVKAQGIDARFILVGPGGVSNKTAITDAEIAQWQQEAVVEYVGSQDDIIPWVLQAHVLVLPSYREGMPRTVLEAASLGRPAIVTDVPGCRQAIVAGATGWLCQVRSAQSLADVMRQVATAPEDVVENFGKAARKRVEEVFSEQRVIDAYMACL